MPSIKTILDTECIGDSRQTINDNFSNLNVDINNNTTSIASLSSNLINIGYKVENVTNFVYSIFTDNSNRSPGMTNTWKDVYTDTSLTPLRVTYTNDSVTRNVLLQGKLYARCSQNAGTVYFRLARFDSATGSTKIATIETAACEGNVLYSHTYNTMFNSVYTVSPNTTYYFGLQTWIPRYGGTAGSNSFLSMNGWQTPYNDSGASNYKTPYSDVRANAATVLQKSGWTDSDNDVGITSYLKLIVL
jgi:hypothetical protein